MVVEDPGSQQMLPECADSSGDRLPGVVGVVDVIWVGSLDLKSAQKDKRRKI